MSNYSEDFEIAFEPVSALFVVEALPAPASATGPLAPTFTGRRPPSAPSSLSFISNYALVCASAAPPSLFHMISEEDRLLSFETPGTERCTARRTHRRTDRCTGRRTDRRTDRFGVPTVAPAAPVHRPVQRQVRRPVHYLAQDRRRGAYTGHLMPRLRGARKKTQPRRARINRAGQTPTERKRVPESAETRLARCKRREPTSLGFT